MLRLIFAGTARKILLVLAEQARAWQPKQSSTCCTFALPCLLQTPPAIRPSPFAALPHFAWHLCAIRARCVTHAPLMHFCYKVPMHQLNQAHGQYVHRKSHELRPRWLHAKNARTRLLLQHPSLRLPHALVRRQRRAAGHHSRRARRRRRQRAAQMAGRQRALYGTKGTGQKGSSDRSIASPSTGGNTGGNNQKAKSQKCFDQWGFE